MEQQRTLHIGDRIIYCYEDGSIEFLSTAKSHAKHPLVRTFGSNRGDGYRHINIKLNGKTQTLNVHRLIATAFHSNPNGLPEVDHINRNRSDNRASNLRWSSAKENTDNQDKVERSIAKYGVRKCESPKLYRERQDKQYRASHVFLMATQPSGKQTRYGFNSVSDPAYLALKPLSQKERYYKYNEMKREANNG